jgi:hypothetical protein
MLSRQGGDRKKWLDKFSLSTLFLFFLCSTISLILTLIGFLLILSNGVTLIAATLTIVSSVFTIVFLPISYSITVKTLKESYNKDSDENLATRSTPQNYKSIINLIPPTNPSIFEQREIITKDIYEKMLQGNSTVFVLTGIVGCGKTTVAALVCRYSEQQRKSNSNSCPFTDEPIWLEADSGTTIAHLTKTLLEKFDKKVPELESMTPQMQASTLITRLNEIMPKRLIILDQFDKMLDFQSGSVSADGVGVWLDNLLTEKYSYKVLITSRCWPIGPTGIADNESNKYLLGDLEDAEARQLLLNQGGSKITSAEPDEFQQIFTYCNKHVWAVKLLADILREHVLSLSDFLSNNNDEIGLWFEKLGHYDNGRGLDIIYCQLDSIQRALVRAFSIFRKPVPLDAARAIVKSVDLKIGIQYLWEIFSGFFLFVPLAGLSPKLGALLRHHLLKVIENPQVNYLLHPLVANYIHYHFVEKNEEANMAVLQVAHNDAAKFYASRKDKCRNREEKQANKIEEIWHQNKAGKWEEAYNQLIREDIYFEASSQYENADLEKLCIEMLSNQHLDNSRQAFVYSQLGRICEVLRKNRNALIYFTKAHELFEETQDKTNNKTMLRKMRDMYAALGDNQRAGECDDEANNLD